MKGFKNGYKILYMIPSTVAIVAVGFYAVIYILLSMPNIQEKVKTLVANELCSLVKSKVEIGSLNILPFNEVKITDFVVYEPSGIACINAKRIDASINIWKLIGKREVELNYIEVDNLVGKVYKHTPQSPLNIQFLIDAFKTKDSNKKSPLRVALKKIVLRNTILSYNKDWVPNNSNKEHFDASHIVLKNINGNFSIPEIYDGRLSIIVHKLGFRERSGFEVDNIASSIEISRDSLIINPTEVKLPKSDISVSRLSFSQRDLKDFDAFLKRKSVRAEIQATPLSLPDIHYFYQAFEKFGDPIHLNTIASIGYNTIDIESLRTATLNNELRAEVAGTLYGFRDFSRCNINVRDLNLHLNPYIKDKVVGIFKSIPDFPARILKDIGEIDIVGSGTVSLADNKCDAKADILSAYGDIKVDGECDWSNKLAISVKGIASSSKLNLGDVLDVKKLGDVAFNTDFNGTIRKGDVDGDVSLDLLSVEYNGNLFERITAEVDKRGKEVSADVTTDDDKLRLTLMADFMLDDKLPEAYINSKIQQLRLSSLGIASNQNYEFAGESIIHFIGNNIENIEGSADFRDLIIKRGDKSVELNELSVMSSREDSYRSLAIRSNFLNGDIVGNFSIDRVAVLGKTLISKAFPTIIPNELDIWQRSEDSANIRFSLGENEPFTKLLGLPIHLGKKMDITGYFDCRRGVAELKLAAPYIITGESNLIRNTSVNLLANVFNGINSKISSSLPFRDDIVNINLGIDALKDRMGVDCRWKFSKHPDVFGNIDLSAYVSMNPYTHKPEFLGFIMPTSFNLKGAQWDIKKSTVSYANNSLYFNNLKISHGRQFLNINGKASESPNDIVHIKLASMDLSYIFDVLNIKYVDFGGVATGEVRAANVFTKVPRVRTDLLYVNNFSYNGAILGNAKLHSYWDNPNQMVVIGADIENKRKQHSYVNGGIFVAKDSLSFDFNANHLNIKLLKPFFSGFTSDVGGEASGNLKLYGTFQDLDLAGRCYADSLYMKVDFTNVTYHCSDSVFFQPGKITIPAMKIYDKNGNSGTFSGEILHSKFRDMRYDFRLQDAHNLLCFNTNSSKGLSFYGEVYASGVGSLKGNSENIALSLNLTPSQGSDFSFVLNEVKTASEYSFLSYVSHDKTKEEELSAEELYARSLKDAERKYLEKSASIFSLNLVAHVNQDFKINLLMNQNTGDGITARGDGTVTLQYNTGTNVVDMYGKYMLQQGNYKFSGQEIFVRDFKINQGSYIEFQGDPMSALLSINASYRVNANLADLDPSFSNDPDLNRTNVPVDAVLQLTGALASPEINFDILLPTLTQDTQRKVKSILSAEDMMNKQVYSLLLMNKFYTPEYIGTTSLGTSELASVASSAVAGQLTSFLNQFSENLSFNPAFRSQKGDFTDIEVDAGFSGSWFNNRLTLNGNFGYRDRATSNTTFVGDFDGEYKLTSSGSLSIKGYHHSNDQNYYLRSANTTQGLGVIFRKEFDDFSTLFKKLGIKLRKSQKSQNDDQRKDSIKYAEPLLENYFEEYLY